MRVLDKTIQKEIRERLRTDEEHIYFDSDGYMNKVPIRKLRKPKTIRNNGYYWIRQFNE